MKEENLAGKGKVEENQVIRGGGKARFSLFL
jgi:hypothetical protein